MQLTKIVIFPRCNTDSCVEAEILACIPVTVQTEDPALGKCRRSRVFCSRPLLWKELMRLPPEVVKSGIGLLQARSDGSSLRAVSSGKVQSLRYSSHAPWIVAISLSLALWAILALGFWQFFY
jgi:hypothetical protein